MVEVGALLSIDLDSDKILVHQSRHVSIGVGFAFHNVTPVTGGVANGEEDRLVFLPGPGQGFLTPGIPVNRVSGMLQQIRTVLEHQPVVACPAIRR
jgi:hypothetical protein